MIRAKAVADSICNSHRIVTIEADLPRFILAELNTHRMFSRNSASSRAIPFSKMVKTVQENPFIPIAWQKDHKGMQGTEYIDGDGTTRSQSCVDMWLYARNRAVEEATELYNYGVTKQLCNRLLEPFMWHKVLITATEWENFFELRCPQYIHNDADGHSYIYRSRKDFSNGVRHSTTNYTDIQWLKLNKGQAEIHMMALAEAMWDAYNESTPKQLKAGEWHIPYSDKMDDTKIHDDVTAEEATMEATYRNFLMDKVRISTAMCARVSYTTVGEEDKPANYVNDIKLHNRLLESKHMSPFEHCARAMAKEECNSYLRGIWNEDKGTISEDIYGWCRNFRGWIQYRELIEN